MSNDKNSEKTTGDATRSQLYELSQDIGVNPSPNPTMGDIIAETRNRGVLANVSVGSPKKSLRLLKSVG